MSQTMSPCIIPMRHHYRFIKNYMGKLRFTLTNIIFWIVLLLSCLLSENFAVLNSDPLKGFAVDSAFILTISIILLLALYYFLEHKKNKLTLDKVLLPSLGIAGLLLIFNVMRQDNRVFPNWDNTGTFSMAFSISDRLMASLQVVIWLAVIYAVVFVYNRFRLNKESLRWVGKIYLIASLLLCLIDAFMEGNIILSIFQGTNTSGGLQFLMGNANIWSLLIFGGFVTAVILSYKRFRWYYYVAMVSLYLFNFFTSCATTTYLCTGLIVIYSIFEIVSVFRTNRRFRIRYIALYLGIVASLVLTFAAFVWMKVPLFVNLWSFINNSLFHKEFATMTGRVDIWQKIFDLLKANPLDFIFGLGHKTGNKILVEYSTTIRTAHNAIMEMFLRYGLIGACIYIGIVGLTIYALIKHIQKKHYRFAIIYGLCFAAIFCHSMTESTTLFTPNVGGLYFSFVFVLPILNIIQEKHMNELKQDVITADVKRGKLNPSLFVYGLIILAFSVAIAKILNLALYIDIFSTILVSLAVFMISLVIISLLRKNSEYNPFEIFANNTFVYYQNLIRKENNNE